jgi:DNA-binding response OmpR family regulator
VWEKILIVDDRQSLRHLLHAVLENAGYRVVLAADGEEAVRLAESGRPNLIIPDAKESDPNGIKTCRARRQRSRELGRSRSSLRPTPRSQSQKPGRSGSMI